MPRGGLRKGLYLLLPSRAAVIPSGESPDGTGESPVLPMLFFDGLLHLMALSIVKCLRRVAQIATGADSHVCAKFHWLIREAAPLTGLMIGIFAHDELLRKTNSVCLYTSANQAQKRLKKSLPIGRGFRLKNMLAKVLGWA
jgi:hypothetical protein